MSVLYIGRSAWRRVWPYHAQAENVARTILTVHTKSGSFSFLVADLEHGPILAPEFGFFVRVAEASQAQLAETTFGQPAATIHGGVTNEPLHPNEGARERRAPVGRPRFIHRARIDRDPVLRGCRDRLLHGNRPSSVEPASDECR